MHCKSCGKNVRSISHWAREHPEVLRRHRHRSRGSKTRGKSRSVKSVKHELYRLKGVIAGILDRL